MVEDLSIKVRTYGDEHKFESCKTRTEYGLDLTRVIHNLLLEAESLDHHNPVNTSLGAEEIAEERASVSLFVRPHMDLKGSLMMDPADGDAAFEDGQSTAGVRPAYTDID